MRAAIAGLVLSGATFTRAAFGPFPAGSVVRSLVCGFDNSSPGSTAIGIATSANRESLEASQASFTACEQVVGLNFGPDTALSGDASQGPSIGVIRGTNCVIPLNHTLEQGGYIGVSLFSAGSAGAHVGFDVAPPELSAEEAFERSRPGTVTRPTAAAKQVSDRVPRVINRSAAPMPVQSGTQPTPQPTANFGK